MSDHTPEVPQKQCSKCKKLLPATAEYFCRMKQSADGLRPNCKVCHSAQSRRHRAENMDTIREKDRLRNKTPQRQDRQRKSYWANPDKSREQSRESRKKNIDKVREREKQRSIRDRDKRNAMYRRMYKENAEQRKEKQRQWYNENKESVIAKGKHRNQRRRARQNNLPSTYTSEEWQRCLDYFGGCCVACGRSMGLFHSITMDHWIPISHPDCPGHVATNVVPLCFGINGCNNSKHNKDPETWVIATFGKRKGRKILKRIADYFATVRSAKG